MDTVFFSLVSVGIELDDPGNVHRELLLSNELPIGIPFQGRRIMDREHYHYDWQLGITYIGAKIGHERRESVLPIERVFLRFRIFTPLPKNNRPDCAVGRRNRFYTVHA